MILSISNMLKQVSEAETKKEKIRLLRYYDHPGLRQLLAMALDPKVKWLLPEGRIQYKPCPDQHDQKGGLFNEIRRMYLYIEGGNTNLQQDKREKLFAQMLEKIDPQDAELLISVKDKKIPYRSITWKLVNEAFPGLL